jgi:DNA-binding transcriptional regulator GbsR (MarR family)
MAVFKPRERLVYFRISEDEFHQFVGLCEQEGARSVSDLARSAVQRLIADGSRQREDKELAPRIEQLDKLIAEVRMQLQFLATIQTQASDPNGNGGAGGHASAVDSADQVGEKEQTYGNPA